MLLIRQERWLWSSTLMGNWTLAPVWHDTMVDLNMRYVKSESWTKYAEDMVHCQTCQHFTLCIFEAMHLMYTIQFRCYAVVPHNCKGGIQYHIYKICYCNNSQSLEVAGLIIKFCSCPECWRYWISPQMMKQWCTLYVFQPFFGDSILHYGFVCHWLKYWCLNEHP